MTDIVLLDDSYTDNPVFYHPERQTILRKVEADNEFLCAPELHAVLMKYGVVPYGSVHFAGVDYFEIEPFFFPNSAANWSYSMYRDCTVLYRKLYDELSSMGLTLIDGHCFNFVFYNSNPVFVDLGSIQRGKTAQGLVEFARYSKVLFSYRVSTAPYTRQRLDSELEAPCYRDLLRDVLAFDYFVSWPNKIRRILGLGGSSTWRHYYSDSPETYADLPKENAVRQILTTLKPSTVYDIGCNSGHYSFIAEAAGARVVACDPDPDCIDYLYNALKGSDSQILPLVADLDGFLRALERPYLKLRPQRVDMVLMLALIHHLTYRVGLTFEDVFERVQRMGADALVLEFVSKKDANVRKWDTRAPREWYSLEQLCAVGSRYFGRYEVHDDHDSERPIVLFYGKKCQ